MNEEFTLRFELKYDDSKNQRRTLSAEVREQVFAAEQIKILLKYVTLYKGGERIDPDAFAIINSPDKIITIQSVGLFVDE